MEQATMPEISVGSFTDFMIAPTSDKCFTSPSLFCVSATEQQTDSEQLKHV
jgi:hypothetical protein